MTKDSIYMSHLDRVMKCPGSLDFTNPLEDPDTTKRDEGSVAAEYFEKKILELDIGTHTKKGLPYTDEMPIFLDPIVDSINALDNPKHSTIQVETRCDWVTRAGIWLRGKFDVSLVHQEDTLYIGDLKYGWGLVEVHNNWQLIAYAIGEVIRRGKAFNKIVLQIYQPRPHHEDGVIRSWEMSYKELMDYKEKIEAKMLEIKNGNNTLATGNHCKFCSYATSCPAMNKSFYRGVDVIHEFLEDNISDQELAFQLDLINRIEEIMKIKKSSMELLATTRIKDGKIIPGYAIMPNIADRQWKKEVSPELIKLMTGYDIIEQKILSPAKAEKLGVPKDIIAKMVERPFLGNKLKKSNTTKTGNQIFGNKQPTKEI